jgi:hypothetical protein
MWVGLTGHPIYGVFFGPLISRAGQKCASPLKSFLLYSALVGNLPLDDHLN